MRLDVGTRARGGVNVQILPDGTVNILRADNGAVVRTSNIFDDFAANLPTIANNQLLTKVTLADPATGNVLAEFSRATGVWLRLP